MSNEQQVIATSHEPAQLFTKTGNTISLPELIHIPQFTNNLLSIHQRTTSNECNILFTKDGGFLTKTTWTPPPASIIETIGKTSTGYNIALSLTKSNTTQGLQHTAPNKTRYTHAYEQTTQSYHSTTYSTHTTSNPHQTTNPNTSTTTGTRTRPPYSKTHPYNPIYFPPPSDPISPATEIQ